MNKVKHDLEQEAAYYASLERENRRLKAECAEITNTLYAENERLQAERDRYREALELIIHTAYVSSDSYAIAKQALQESE